MKQAVLLVTADSVHQQLIMLVNGGCEIVSVCPRFKDGMFTPDGYIIVFKGEV